MVGAFFCRVPREVVRLRGGNFLFFEGQFQANGEKQRRIRIHFVEEKHGLCNCTIFKKFAYAQNKYDVQYIVNTNNSRV